MSRSSDRPPPVARTGRGCFATSLVNSTTATYTTGTCSPCPSRSKRCSRHTAGAPSSEFRPLHRPAGVTWGGREGDVVRRVDPMRACVGSETSPRRRPEIDVAFNRQVSLLRPKWRLLGTTPRVFKHSRSDQIQPADPLHSTALHRETRRCSLGPRGSEGQPCRGRHGRSGCNRPGHRRTHGLTCDTQR